MTEHARDLIANIIAQLHELYWLTGTNDHASGLDRVEHLVGKLRDLEGASIGRRASTQGSERRLPGIVTTDDEPPLVDQLNQELQQASEVRIASAFLSAADTNPIIKSLRVITQRSVAPQVRVLTSVMGFFNRPDALRAFRDWGPGLELRLYHEHPAAPQELLAGQSRGFHAKTILIQRRRPPHLLLVGSANLTTAGLEGNVEWNYLSDFEVNVGLGEEASPYERAVDLFDHIWEYQSFRPDDGFLQAYENIYNRGRSLRQQLSRLGSKTSLIDAAHRQTEDAAPRIPAVAPRPAQQQALKEMAAMRSSGSTRYAVIAATGVGKTMLSAFDVGNVGARRVLFLAHRRHILEQAARDYARVLGDQSRQILLQGRDSASELYGDALQVFAMVWTLGNENLLKRLPPNYFDYIVVDEFHHAAADTYRRVLDHFEPLYLLGMTATPERTDGQDVLEVCDRNIAYEVRLLEAVDRGWLAPFQYYALYDPVDYSQLRWTGVGYDEAQLEEHLSRDTRADLIVTNLHRYQPSHETRKTIAFCSNVGHARWMAIAFRERGLEAAALTGATSEAERARLVERLEDDNDTLEILCTVDVLGEGVDIPSVTHILLLRPTHSFTVFIQQLGRGLRPYPGKSFVVILDFVGNYRKSFVAPLALSGHSTVPERISQVSSPSEFELPKACHVDADAEVMRIWQEELRSLDPASRRLNAILVALEELAGDDRRLSDVRLPELFIFATGALGGEHDEPQQGSDHKSSRGKSGQDLAPRIRESGGWLRVRQQLNLADDYEQNIIDTPGEALIKHVEDELSPTKSYKMAVLHTLLDMAVEELQQNLEVEDRAKAPEAAGTPQALVVPELPHTEWHVGEIASRFLRYYLANHRRIADWPALSRAEEPESYPMSRVIRHLKSMPLEKLSNSDQKPFVLDGDRFAIKKPYSAYWKEPRFRELVRERVQYAEARYWDRQRA